MEEKKNTLKQSVVRSALALALVAGLVPAQALPSLAFADPAAPEAAEQSSGAANQHVEAVPLQPSSGGSDAEAGSQSEAADGPEAPAQAEAAPKESGPDADAGAQAPAPAVPAASQGGAPASSDAAALDADDRMSATVALGSGSAAGTVVSYGGLTFAISDGDTPAATVVGWTGSAPAGTLTIPAEVRRGDAVYPVTAIKGAAALALEADAPAAGQGEAAPGDADPIAAANTGSAPYITDYYDAAAKAPQVTSVDIPASVTAIDLSFFQQFPAATEITVRAGNPSYTSHNGMLLDAAANRLLLVPEGMEGTAGLPDTMASVPACVFSRCTKLSAIVVSQTGGPADSSFASADGILYTADKATLLAAPAGLGASAKLAPECTKIAEGAFWGNAALGALVVNSTVTQMVVNPAFDGSAVAKALVAGTADGLDTEAPAFEPAVIKGATVVLATADDGAKAVWEMAGFTRFSEPAQPGDQIAPVEGSGFAFDLLPDYTLAVRWQGEDPAPAALDIPAYGILDGVSYSVSAIAADGFKGQASVLTVDMPATVTAIGAGAFEGCANLKTARLNNGVRAIGDRAFKGTALLSLVLPADLAALGSEALGGLEGTTIVARHSVDSVAGDALLGSAGVSLYVPAAAADDWNSGLPAAGNHIYMYGVQLPEAALTLEAGQSASLFADGALEAPGAVEVSYAYKAKSLSIAEDGTVEAKQAGDSRVKVELSIPLEEVVVKAIKTEDVRLRQASTRVLPVDGAPATTTITTPVALTSAEQGVSVAAAAGSTRASYQEGYVYVHSNLSLSSSDSSPAVSKSKELTFIPPIEFFDNPDDNWISFSGDAMGISLAWQHDSTWSGMTTYTTDYADTGVTTAIPEEGPTITGEILDPGQTPSGVGSAFGGQSWSSGDVIHIYLEWKVSIEWDPNGGYYENDDGTVGGKSTSTHVVGKTASGVDGSGKPLNPGMNFAGWATSKTATTGTSTVTITEDVSTYYAIWANSTYEITWNPNGGKWSDNTTSSKKSTHSANASVSGLDGSTKPTKVGYSFNGWATSSTATSGSTSVTITSSRTYYATWKAKTSALTFNINGGSGTVPTGKTATYGSNMPSITGTFTRTGYTFGGWYDTSAATGGTQYYTNLNASARTWNKDTTAGTTLYARWVPKTSALTFNINGGSGTVPTGKTATYGKAMPSISGTFTRTGYDFGGWYDTSAATGGTQYYTSGNASARNWNKDKTTGTTLYARWNAKSYTVKFNANGGTGGTHPDVTATYGSALPKPSGYTAPTKTGHTLQGWYDTSAASGGTKYLNADGSTSDCTTWNKTATTTLYARWQINTYTVIWSASGGVWPDGTTGDKTSTHPYGTTVSGWGEGSAVPTRDNYDFSGWRELAYDFDGANSFVVNRDLEVYAEWRESKATITFNTANNGGTVKPSGAQENVPVLTGSVSSTATVSPGYVFAGWWDGSKRITATSGNVYVSSDGLTLYVKGSASSPLESKTYTANFTGKDITLKWNSDGGSAVADTKQKYTSTSKVILPTTEPTRDGYDFAGWFTEAEGGTQVKANTVALPTSDKEYFAHWTARTITVKWNYDDQETWGITTQIYSEDAKVEFPDGQPIQAGYTFNGWVTAFGGSNKVTNDTPLPATDVVYYADWWAINYVVSFDGNGAASGTMADMPSTIYGDYDIWIPKNEYERPGYTFEGWSWSADGSAAFTDGQEIIPEDLTRDDEVIESGNTVYITWYAVWKANSITITWDSNGGEPDSKITTQEYGENEYVEVPDFSPTREGYTLAGWNTSWDGKGESVSDDTPLPSTDINYYAVWEANSYTVEFDGGEGASGGTDAMDMTYDVAAKLTANGFSKTGFTFKGWTTVEGGTTVEYSDQAEVANLTAEAGGTVTLYAVWEAKTYTITFHNDDHYGATTGADAQGKVSFAWADRTKADLAGADAKIGYTFKGWNSGSDVSALKGAGAGAYGGAAALTDEQAQSLFDEGATTDVDLAAVYDIKAYSVVFTAGTYGTIANSADREIADQSYDEIVGKRSVPEVTPRNAGKHTFIGFDHGTGPVEDSSGASIESGVIDDATFKLIFGDDGADGVDEAVRLFGHYTINDYNVQGLIDNDGTVTNGKQEVAYDGTSEAMAFTAKTGYSITGVSVQKGEATEELDLDNLPTGCTLNGDRTEFVYPAQTKVREAITVDVTTTRDSFAVSGTITEDKGSITAGGDQKVSYGSTSADMVFRTIDGHHVSRIRVERGNDAVVIYDEFGASPLRPDTLVDKTNGVTGATYQEYTFAGETITTNVSVSVEVAINGYALTYKTTKNGEDAGEEYQKVVRNVPFGAKLEAGDDGDFAPPTFTMAGYTLGSTWKTGKGEAWSFEGDTMPDGDLTLTAEWVPNETGVTLSAPNADYAQGSDPRAQFVTATYGAAMPATSTAGGALVAPTLGGYTLDGYYLLPEGAKPTGGMFSEAGQTTAVPAGSTLVYVPDGKGSLAGADGFTWSFDISTATLYAHWQRTPVAAVAFDHNGGADGTDKVWQWQDVGFFTQEPALGTDKATGLLEGDRINPAAKDGHTLDGYFDNAALSGKALVNKKGGWKLPSNEGAYDYFTDGTTLYAKWTAADSSIEFWMVDDAGAAQREDSLTIKGMAWEPVNILDELADVDFAKTGYYLDGWYWSDEFDTPLTEDEYTNAEMPGSGEVLKLYGRWVPYRIAVSYDANAGQFAGATGEAYATLVYGKGFDLGGNRYSPTLDDGSGFANSGYIPQDSFWSTMPAGDGATHGNGLPAACYGAGAALDDAAYAALFERATLTGGTAGAADARYELTLYAQWKLRLGVTVPMALGFTILKDKEGDEMVKAADATLESTSSAPVYVDTVEGKILETIYAVEPTPGVEGSGVEDESYKELFDVESRQQLGELLRHNMNMTLTPLSATGQPTGGSVNVVFGAVPVSGSAIRLEAVPSADSTAYRTVRYQMGFLNEDAVREKLITDGSGTFAKLKYTIGVQTAR